MSVKLVFETHSISEDNERGVATGWLPGRLSSRGRELAAQLGCRRPGSEYDMVFTSDLRRAMETAEIAYSSSSGDLRADWRLRECNYGKLNGASVVEVDRTRLQHIDTPFPEGESHSDVVRRVNAFLRDLQAERSVSTALVIGHSATRWALDNILLGTSLENLISAPFTWQEGWEYHLQDPGA